MHQNTYDMKTSDKNTNSYLNQVNNNEKKYYNSKIGKENPNSLTYKLNEIKEAQNKLKMKNDNYNYNQLLNNSNSNATDNSKITNQSKFSKYKHIPTSNNYINNNNTVNLNANNSSNRKSSSRQKQTSSTAQIDEQYEMQKLLELENKNYENKFKDVVYKKLKEKDNNLNSSNNSISVKNNIPVNNNSYYNMTKLGYKKNLNINDDKENEIDKNIKNYIDEQAEKIKEFVHEEINNLHVDLIRQFEIQNSQNLKMMQEFSLLNKQLYQEILKLKNENNILKNNINNSD